MKKLFKLGVLFMASMITAISSTVAADQSRVEAESSQPMMFSPLSGLEWVKQCIKQYPEIEWLAGKAKATQEGNATETKPYSEQIYPGAKGIFEFDRTIMTLHCMKLILDGSEQAYLDFTAAQKPEVKLTRNSFKELHEQGKALLQSQWNGLTETQMAQVLETALVLGDMGKTEKAREIFKPYGVTAPDHDDFYGEAMKVLERHPELCPSFQKLPPEGKKLLQKVANLAHYGHIYHLEGAPSMFTHLKESKVPSSDPVALNFDLFVHNCDVAGAAGHANKSSSLTYTEQTHQGKKAMGEAVRVLKDLSKSEVDAYMAYVKIRASWIGLNPEDGLDRVLTRIGAMVRLFTVEEGKALRKAVEKLTPEDRTRIVNQLDALQGKQLARTPTYMPAVLVNFNGNGDLMRDKEAKLSTNERLEDAVAVVLPFIARVLEQQHKNIEDKKANPEIPLNFNDIAGVAKLKGNKSEQTGPYHYFKGEFAIDAVGNVSVAESPTKEKLK